MTSAAVTTREIQRRTLGGIAWSTASSVLGLPISIGVSVVLARSLGPEAFARFAYLTFLVPTLLAVSDLGFTQAATREAARRLGEGDEDGARLILGKTTGWSLLRAPAAAGIALAIARPPLAVSLVVVAAIVALQATVGLNVALNADNRFAMQAKLMFGGLVVTSAVTVSAALAGATATTVWALSSATSAVVVPGWLALAPRTLVAGALRPRLPRRLGDGFWRFATTTLVTSLGYGLVFSRSEVVVLDAFHHHHALAVFAVAYGISQRLTTPVDTILGPLIPALSALDAAHPDRIGHAFERVVRVAAVGVAGLAVAAVAGSALLVPILYGSQYGGAVAAFLVLVVCSLLQSAAQPYIALAYARGRAGVVLRAYALALAVDLALALVLVPRWPLAGAVAANAAAAATAVACICRWVDGPARLRRAGIRALPLAATATAAMGVSLAVGLAAARIAPAAGALAAFATGGALALLLAPRAAAVLAPDDLRALRDALPPPVRRVADAAVAIAGAAPR